MIEKHLYSDWNESVYAPSALVKGQSILVRDDYYCRCRESILLGGIVHGTCVQCPKCKIYAQLYGNSLTLSTEPLSVLPAFACRTTNENWVEPVKQKSFFKKLLSFFKK